MAVEIVGRDDVLASVDAFIGEANHSPAALVLEGEAGIGKSTVWLAGMGSARERGLRVLSSRPAEAESGLAYAGLGDLFEAVADDVLPALSPPRRRALEVALLVEDAPAEGVDPRALGVALRNSLQLLAEEGPVVVAIDDVQWFDSSSAVALAFALRRLGGIRVLLLLARRLVEGAEPSAIERALDPQCVRRVAVGPLSAGALHRLLRDRLERVFARQTLLRIHERSGGNPFFALELARVLGDDVDPLQPLPVPRRLDELVRRRVAGLPAPTRDALALASALGTPSVSLLERAGVAVQALEPAIGVHVIERASGAVRFTHPLLSSVVYTDLGDRRPEVHRRLAAVVDDPLARARHLALATEEPDADVAAVLDAAVRIAGDRGATNVAAEVAEHALRLSDAEGRHRRALAAARAHQGAGEWTRARAILTDALTAGDLGPLRAEALLLLADFEGLARAVELLEEALAEATTRPALQARIHCRLAWAERFTKGFVRVRPHGEAALRIAEDLDDDSLRVEALGMLVFLGLAIGDPDAPAQAARAREVALAGGDARLLHESNDAIVGLLEVRRSVEEARALLEREYAHWRERDELRAAGTLFELAHIELWGNRWELAAEYADRAYELFVQYGLEVPWIHVPISMIAAHRGRLEEARTHSERALQLGDEQFGRHTPVHLGTLGVVALQAGDPHAAVAWFDEAEATTTRIGWSEAGKRWWVPDHVEALLALERPDEAERVLDVWEADARRLERGWVLAHVTRCRGLVAAVRGDVSGAASLFEDAVAQHEMFADAFGRARALLALGVVRRRQRQKRAARDTIDAALAGFERLGAATWIERARAERGRIGGRTRIEGLTPAEQRVAALVAKGRTNREVAAALFLGERTVETHLSHVYAKLGVRSRAELARAFASEQSSGRLTISS